MRPISRAKAHMPQGKPERVVRRPWLEPDYGIGARKAAEEADSQAGGDSAKSAHRSGDASRRLDMELVERGIADTRTKARRLVESGAVSVDGATEKKPSRKVRVTSHIDVMPQGHEYVSRGAYKLLGAFERFTQMGLASPAGKQCLDIGASTGGFTQVLLEHGATEVIALDVGHGQLVEELQADTRVIEMSGVNIRAVTTADLPFQPTYVVSDVSFISLTYVLPVIARIAAPHAEIVVLVKPQFEVGKGNLGKDGIVTDHLLREESLKKVTECALSNGLEVKASTVSPIEGAHGNVEYLLWLRQTGE